MEVKYTINPWLFHFNHFGMIVSTNCLFALMGITFISTPVWYVLWVVLIWGGVFSTIAEWSAKKEVKSEG